MLGQAFKRAFLSRGPLYLRRIVPKSHFIQCLHHFAMISQGWVDLDEERFHRSFPERLFGARDDFRLDPVHIDFNVMRNGESARDKIVQAKRQAALPEAHRERLLFVIAALPPPHDKNRPQSSPPSGGR